MFPHNEEVGTKKSENLRGALGDEAMSLRWDL